MVKSIATSGDVENRRLLSLLSRLPSLTSALAVSDSQREFYFPVIVSIEQRALARVAAKHGEGLLSRIILLLRIDSNLFSHDLENARGCAHVCARAYLGSARVKSP